MSDQIDLFKTKRTTTLVAAGIKKAKASRPAGWHETVLEGVKKVAETTNFFTTEEVREQVGDSFLGKNPSAIGPVMRAAVAKGYIEFVGYRASERPEHRQRPARLWRSKLFKSAA